MQNTASAPWK